MRFMMNVKNRNLFFRFATCLAVAILIGAATVWNTVAQEPTKSATPSKTTNETDTEAEKVFRDVVQPAMQKYCVRCHNVDKQKSGVRVDQLAATATDRQLPLLKSIAQQIEDEVMPPEGEPQPTEAERKALLDWIPQVMNAAMARNTQKNGSVRRLTVGQYRNTLRDLLGLDEDLTDILPPDGLSKDGFTNNGQTLLLSPLQVEAYFDIASQALDLCIVDENAKPVIETFRMDLGKKINPAPCPDKLVLGANSHLLNNDDFIVTELQPPKPFPYQPFAMQTKFEFIEGYVGNDTIREWRKFDSIYHAVFACMRGSPGYPNGEAFHVVPEGLLLRPAIPNSEIFGVSNTYGPMANFKISLRELPDRGNFRVTVKAARYNDGLLLAAGTPVAPVDAGSITAATVSSAQDAAVAIPAEGIYQVDVYRAADDGQGEQSLELAGRQFNGKLFDSPLPAGASAPDEKASAWLLVRLPAGPLAVTARSGDHKKPRRIVFHPVAADSSAGQRFLTFEKRQPAVGVYVGLRRDCGSTLARVGQPQRVHGGELHDYVFEGPINDFPSPEVEKNNVNYLAGVREIGVRSEYTDGRDLPRLLIRSVEFEGPYYDQWPPATHRKIFRESSNRGNPPVYAREILSEFATRAFRRPCTPEEENALFKVWQTSFATHADFQQSIKDSLLVVLTSPQFLFLVENSAGPQAEDLDDYELASKLSYFLWNTAPDQPLLDLAARKELHGALDPQIDRMVRDPRFGTALHEFVSQWLSLDKFDVVSIDSK
ncbi:MAG: DUF1587 domain-containing protein, partial [Planctomycetes bacterium]|nr:DUF1587 domain-containing protein [Planctomycetota bacterium]